jgi:hypothetical protein
MIVWIVALVMVFGLQTASAGMDDKAVGGPTGTVPLPPFRPSFTWTCIFQEHDPSDRYHLASPKLAGWWLALGHVLTAILLAVTIVGIPFAWAHLKLAGLALWPIGKIIVSA